MTYIETAWTFGVGVGGSSVGGKMVLSPKMGIFLETEKWPVRTYLGIHWNIVYLLEQVWRVLMGKKWGGNKKKRFYSKMWGNGVWRGLAKILWTSPYVMVLWKLSLLKDESLLRGGFGWDRVAYWSQRCQWLLLPLLSFWSHHYRLYWCMPRKKEVDILGWSRCWLSA